MKFSLYIAKRYLFSKSKNNAINIISFIASAGVIFGSLLLLVVLSGFSGLKTFSLSYSSIIDPDFKIFPEKGKRLTVTQAELGALQNTSGVLNYSKVVEEKVFLQFKDKNELAVIKGVDENYGKTVYADSIVVYGKWLAPKSYQTVSGFLLADKLDLGVFDYRSPLELFVPKPGTGQVNQNTFNRVATQNVGLFEINEELNQQIVFTSLEAGQELLGYNNQAVSYIELKADENVDDSTLKDAIQDIFKGRVIVKNRVELNDALHKMLNTENIAVYLIFTLILIVALFNVIGSIIMMIIDKKRNIKTLFNLGATLKEIKQIFFLQGTLLTVIGGTFGVLVGILLVGAQLLFEFIKIPGTSLPYPVELTLLNILIVLVTIFVLGTIASKVASYRISKKLIEAN